MATTISQGSQPSFLDNLLGAAGHTIVGGVTGGVSNLFNAGQDIASNFFNPQAHAEGLPPTRQQVLGVQQAQGIPSTPYGPANPAQYGPANPATGVVGGTTQTAPTNNGGGSYTPPKTLSSLTDEAARNEFGMSLAELLKSNSAAQQMVRNDISSSWDNYLNSLNDTSGFLNDQRTAQEGVAHSQLQQGINTANDQKAKSLRDIANTTKNAFQAGNNYLGSLGAGDSSAANQYAFAINQEAGKQTGDLNNFVAGQIQNLQSQHDQQIGQIASWFAQQQEGLRNQIAQGQLNKGQDLANLSKGILDQAMQATNQIKANTQNQYNALVTWAANNSQNMGQLQQNIAAIPRAMGQIQSTGGVGAFKPVYGGTSTTQKTDIFGNPIQ